MSEERVWPPSAAQVADLVAGYGPRVWPLGSNATVSVSIVAELPDDGWPELVVEVWGELDKQRHVYRFRYTAGSLTPERV